MPGYIHKPGDIGVVSRGGTLTYEVVAQLIEQGLGQSTYVGLGGDSLPGSNFVDILKLFQLDPETRGVVLIGEFGGTCEQDAAEFIRNQMTKPVIAYVAGSSAPPDRRMGHAEAIITSSDSKASEKINSLSAAGATLAENFAEIGVVTRETIRKEANPQQPLAEPA